MNFACDVETMKVTPLFMLLLAGCSSRSFDRKELERDFPAQVQSPTSMTFLDGRHLWVRGGSGQFTEDRVWDPESGALLSKYIGRATVPRPCVLPDVDFSRVVIEDEKNLRIVSLPEETELAKFESTRGCPIALLDDDTVLTQNRERIASFRGKGEVWSYTFTTTPWFAVHAQHVAYVDAKSITVVDFRTGVTKWTASVTPSTVQFSSDGEALRVGGEFFDAASGERIALMQGRPQVSWFSKREAIIYEPSGTIRRVKLDGTKVWELRLEDEKRQHRPLLAHMVSGDGSFIVMQIENVGTVDLYDASNGRKLLMLARHDDYRQGVPVEQIAISPDMKNVAVSLGRTLVIWPMSGSKKFRAMVDPTLK